MLKSSCLSIRRLSNGVPSKSLPLRATYDLTFLKIPYEQQCDITKAAASVD